MNKDSFKYLGLLVYRTYIAKSADHVLGPLMAGCHRIRQFPREHQLMDRPLALLWLAKCYAIKLQVRVNHQPDCWADWFVAGLC